MVSVLERLPALATTGIGSLPFDDPAVAVRHATRAYAVPFCPQMPRVDGDMVREWLGPGWTRTPCGWSPERDRERPAAWDAFVRALEGRPPESRVVKLQVTGPVTLAVAMERAAGRPGTGREVEGLAAELAVWLASSVVGQTARLRDLGLDALLLVDEPGLGHAAASSADALPVDPRVWDPLRAAAPAWGLHVCSAVPWALVRAAEPDVLSFDATRYAVGGAGATVLAELVARGGRVAWGVLDPVRPDAAFDAAARVAAGIGAMTAVGGDLAVLVERSLLTPSCGTGRLAPARERLVASVLDAAGATVDGTWRSWPRTGVRAEG